MPKYLVTWTTNAVVIEAEDEEKCHDIATALVADGRAFNEFIATTIVEMDPAPEVWSSDDVELGETDGDDA
jgi:hypothetical protein